MDFIEIFPIWTNIKICVDWNDIRNNISTVTHLRILMEYNTNDNIKFTNQNAIYNKKTQVPKL
jgi:hypothetical protein